MSDVHHDWVTRDDRLDGPDILSSPDWAARAEEGAVVWLRRRRVGGSSGPPGRPTNEQVKAAMAHLTDFVATRPGVEMYVEPRTTVTPTTIVLIATTGEWTRRRVADERAAAGLAKELGVPAYDVQLTGYPARMREWNARQGGAGSAG
jgi:hypothetical protein